MAGTVSNNIVKDGLIIYLDAGNPQSYVSGSTTWNDLSGNLNTGSLIGGPTFSSANLGSIVFDGIDDYCVQTTATYKDYTTITATIWFFVNNPAFSSPLQTFFSYNSEQSGLTQGWGVRKNGDFNLEFWGGTGNGGIKLYVNGILINSSNTTSKIMTSDKLIQGWNTFTLVAKGVTSWNTHNRFTISTRSDNLGTALTNNSYSNFKLYNRELTAQEILQNYNALKHRYNVTTTYTFTEGGGGGGP